MAQESSVSAGRAISKALLAKNLAAAVAGTGNTVLLELQIEGLSRLWAEFKPTVHALDAFVIAVKFHPDGDYVTLYNTGTDFTSPDGKFMLKASGDLTGLAASGTGYFVMDVVGLYGVKISVSGASDGTLVDSYAGGA